MLFCLLFVHTTNILGLLLGGLCGFGVGGTGWAIRIVSGVSRGAGQPANGHWALRWFRFFWRYSAMTGDTGNSPNAITKAGWGVNVPALYNSRNKTQPMLCALVTMSRDVDPLNVVTRSVTCICPFRTPYLHASDKGSWERQARKLPHRWSSHLRRHSTKTSPSQTPKHSIPNRHIHDRGTAPIASHEPPTPTPSSPPMPTGGRNTPPNPQLPPSPSPSPSTRSKPPSQHQHQRQHQHHLRRPQPPTCPSKP